VRLASAYADLLQAQGEDELAAAWLTAIAAADPEDLTGAVDRLGIEFVDLEEDFEDGDSPSEAEAEAEVEAEGAVPEAPTGPEIVEELPEDAHGLGKSFDDEVEAEVAELLGEIDPPARPSSDAATDDGPH
jgi:hypothetical protein